MNPIWLKHYPKDVPHTILLTPEESLISMFDETCQDYGKHIALECLGTQLSFENLYNKALCMSAYLQDVLHLKKGDRFGIFCPNILQYHISLFAAHRLGLIVVGINPMYTTNELEYIITDAQITTLIALDFFACTVEKAALQCPELKNIIITSVGDIFPFGKAQFYNFAAKHIKHLVTPYHLPSKIKFKTCLSYPKNHFKPIEITGSDIAFLQYTGGTTGRSKGAILTHGNVVANIKQVKAGLTPILEQHDHWLAPLPLFHIFGLTSSLTAMLGFASRNILISDPRDIKTSMKIIKKSVFHVITGVNTLFSAWVHQPHFSSYNFSHLKTTWAGGMPVQRYVAEQWKLATGCDLHVAYGLSETSPGISSDFYNQKGFSDSLGYPFPSTIVSIRDPDSFKEVELGQPGEICVKGPQVMQGYWNQPELTQKSLIDGIFRTGDIGIMNENGQIKMVDRIKDLVIISGFNVYTIEVEHTIAEIPEVYDVAVIGIPTNNNGDTTERLKAHVVLKPGAHLSSEDIINFCKTRITRYKIPKLYSFDKHLPLSAVGKVLKTELRKHPDNIQYFEKNEP